MTVYREYAQLGDAALSPARRKEQAARKPGVPSVLHDELAMFHGWIVESNAKLVALRSLADELAEDQLAAELEAEERGRSRPPVDPDAGPVSWRVWDDVRSIELEPVTSATLEGARKKARRAHPGLRKVRVEPIAAAP